MEEFINDMYDSKKIYCLSSSGCEVLDADHDDLEWRPVSPSLHQPDSAASLGAAIYSVSRGRAEVYCPDKGNDLHQSCQQEPSRGFTHSSGLVCTDP